MAQIIGIGANLLDTLFTLKRYPAEDTKQAASLVTERGGGPCGTGLVAAAKLGARCAYIGHCSDDNAGRFLRADFEKYGIDVALMQPVTGATAFRSCIWLCEENASRTCVFHRGTVPPTVLGEAEKAALRGAELLMVDGNDLDAAVEGAQLVRESGGHVLYDAGGRYPGVERLLPFADILIPSEEFALGVTGEKTAGKAAEALYRKYHPSVAVVTQGKQGGVLLDENGLRAYPAFPVTAVDTNGAGDVFHGAFAFALLQRWDHDRCCRFASAVSALKCTGLGARESTPDYAQTTEFLRSRGIEI